MFFLPFDANGFVGVRGGVVIRRAFLKLTIPVYVVIAVCSLPSMADLCSGYLTDSLAVVLEVRSPFLGSEHVDVRVSSASPSASLSSDELSWSTYWQLIDTPVQIKSENKISREKFNDWLKKATRDGQVVGASYAGLDPISWQSMAVKKLVKLLLDPSQPISRLNPQLGVSHRADLSSRRSEFVNEFYKSGLARADFWGYLISDKLIMGKVIEEILGPEQAYRYYPKSRGLKEILLKNGWVDVQTGLVSASREEIANGLKREFPEGFIVKKSMDFSSKGKNIYTDEAEVAKLLASGESDLYKPGSLFSPCASLRFGYPHLTSGEEYFFMGKLAGSRITHASKDDPIPEYRLHVTDGRVISSATYSRWYQEINPGDKEIAESTVQEFFDKMPVGFTRHQVYSLDVVVTDGKAGIVEIGGNFGQKKGWSGFLRTPSLIKSLAEDLRDHYAWRFEGIGAELIFGGHANLVNNFYGDLIETLEEGEDPEADWAEVIRYAKSEMVQTFDIAFSMRKEGRGLDNPVIQEALEIGPEYVEMISKVNRVGDSGWQRFRRWAEQTIRERVRHKHVED